MPGAPDLASGDLGETGRALYQAIVADPEDVASRRVFADLLLERGDSWGELILGQLDGDPGGGRVADLALEHATRIAGELERRATRFEVRRGFVEHVVLPLPVFAVHGPAVFAAHPITDLAVIVRTQRELDQLAALALPATLRRLQIWTHVAAGTRYLGLGALIERDAWPVRELVLRGIGAESADWVRLLGASLLGGRAPRLTGLELAGCHHGPELLSALAVPDAPPPLRSLALRSSRVLASGALKNVPRSRSRSLSAEHRARTEIAASALPAHAAALAGSAVGRGLRSLALPLWQATPTLVGLGAGLFGTSASLQLARLDLDNNASLGDDTLLALADSASAATLRELIVSRTGVQLATVAGVLPRLPALEHLGVAALESGVAQDPTPLVEALLAAPRIARVTWRGLPAQHAARLAGRLV